MDITALGYRTDLALLELGGSVIEDRDDHVVVRPPHNPMMRWATSSCRPNRDAEYRALTSEDDGHEPETYRALADTEVQLAAERPPA